MRQLEYVVDIETWGEGVAAAQNERLFDLHEELAATGASNIATGWGGIAGGPSATFYVTLKTAAREETTTLPRVADLGVKLFIRACEAASLSRAHKGIARVNVMPAIYAQLDANSSSEQLLGIAEIASLLGVSRQRVYELRAKPQFPRPVAELAAGPVWARSAVEAFLGRWDRRPGRPKRASA